MSGWRLPILAVSMASAIFTASSVAAAGPPISRARLDGWTMGQALAACHLGGDKNRLKAALLADPMTGAFEEWTEQRDPTCATSAFRPRGDFFRYAIAEAIFRRDLRDEHLRDLAQVTPLIHARAPLKFNSRMSKKDREEAAGLQAGAIKLSALGECIVRSDPATNHALLSARPASEAETGALTKLMPSVERCIDPTRVTKFDVDDLRGAIALNYVRLAKAPRNPGAAR